MAPTSLEPIVTHGQAPIVTLPTVTLLAMAERAKSNTPLSSNDVKRQFAARLNALCDVAGIPKKFDGRQDAVGKLFGVSQKAARKWLEAEGLPALHTIIRMAIHFEVQVDWLASGREPKRLLSALPEKHRRLIEAYDTAPPTQRRIVDLALHLDE